MNARQGGPSSRGYPRWPSVNCADIATGYRSLDCQKIVYCRLFIGGREHDKSDLMVSSKWAMSTGFVI
jgi:hypothetical protein